MSTRFSLRGMVIVACASGCPAGASKACDAWTAAGGIAALAAHGGQTRAHVHIASNLVTTATGIPPRFTIRDLEVQPKTTQALSLSLGCEFGTRWLLEAEAGIPPIVRARGSGVIAAPGLAAPAVSLDLDDETPGVLVKQRLWNPIVALRYRMGNDEMLVRPFISAGVSYIWFTDEQVRPVFGRAVDRRFGQPLALANAHPGTTRTRVSVDGGWAPVLSTGFDWRLGPAMSLAASVGYSPLAVEAHFHTYAADGTWLASAHTRSEIDAWGAALVMRYRFSRQDD